MFDCIQKYFLLDRTAPILVDESRVNPWVATHYVSLFSSIPKAQIRERSILCSSPGIPYSYHHHHGRSSYTSVTRTSGLYPRTSRYSPEFATFNEREDNEGPQSIESVGVDHCADVVRREDSVNRRVRALPPQQRLELSLEAPWHLRLVARSVTSAAVESGKVERNNSGREGADNSEPKRKELKQKEAESN